MEEIDGQQEDTGISEGNALEERGSLSGVLFKTERHAMSGFKI